MSAFQSSNYRGPMPEFSARPGYVNFGSGDGLVFDLYPDSDGNFGWADTEDGGRVFVSLDNPGWGYSPYLEINEGWTYLESLADKLPTEEWLIAQRPVTRNQSTHVTVTTDTPVFTGDSVEAAETYDKAISSMEAIGKAIMPITTLLLLLKGF